MAIAAEYIPGGVCVHCGRTCRNPQGGYASVDGISVCHPNAEGRPDCYHMITVYKHPLNNCSRCSQNPYVPLTRQELHDAFVAALQNLERMVQDALP